MMFELSCVFLFLNVFWGKTGMSAELTQNDILANARMVLRQCVSHLTRFDIRLHIIVQRQTEISRQRILSSAYVHMVVGIFFAPTFQNEQNEAAAKITLVYADDRGSNESQ